ncbi:hypothetical protein [Bacillus sp. AFS088145]|nr:hypothetical protein [Bacillus sp. AFS088145]
MSNNSLCASGYEMKHGRCVTTKSVCKNLFLLTDLLKKSTITF